MKVTVTVFGALRELAGGQEIRLELAPGARVQEALHACGLPERVDIWVLVDGNKADRSTRLTDGARVCFFQPAGGG